MDIDPSNGISSRVQSCRRTDIPGTGVETTLAGTEWSLVSLNGEELITGTTITLSLEDDYLGGEMGCNGYGNSFDSGKYTAMSDGSFCWNLRWL